VPSAGALAYVTSTFDEVLFDTQKSPAASVLAGVTWAVSGARPRVWPNENAVYAPSPERVGVSRSRTPRPAWVIHVLVSVS